MNTAIKCAVYFYRVELSNLSKISIKTRFRQLGIELGLPLKIVQRHPFPGIIISCLL